ncbi:uncharacterized protein LDX57_011393 [Aspergillus melleus]|uniref:uncharacterized protein n=1 Tax=Aspergillus melleus TaxID=138277 RepID=UPI001E8E757C|nr:uncharacterized protein LDX57_011393 [Aspergillus melleus]KAH8433759.1 hypothetical protein LDX57_011393 [Aspergillus melleus]
MDSGTHGKNATHPFPKPVSTVNYGPELLVTVWVVTGLSIVAVVLRSVSNYKFGNFQLSDLVTLFGLALLITAAAISNIAVEFGYGLAAGSQGPNHEANSLKYSAIGQAIVVLAATAGRIGFILYLIELLAARALHRMVLWLLIPFQIVINAVSVFLLFFQCSIHVGELFHPGRQSHCESLDIQIKYGYFQGGKTGFTLLLPGPIIEEKVAFNSACDLLLAVFPVYIFWRFNWTVRVKLVLISLLSLGVVAMAASLVKTIEYPTIMLSRNPRTNRVTLLRWMFIEAGAVLITASIPCLRPLAVWLVRKFITRVRHRYRRHTRIANGSNTPLSTMFKGTGRGNGNATASASASATQFSQDWKTRWIMPYVQQREVVGEDGVERHILANITTHIFAGDREFLDRHTSGGIVKKVEVEVRVADEIPLTEGGGL